MGARYQLSVLFEIDSVVVRESVLGQINLDVLNFVQKSHPPPGT